MAGLANSRLGCMPQIADEVFEMLGFDGTLILFGGGIEDNIRQQ